MTPLHVAFHGMTSSDDLERCARLELDALTHKYPRIERCDVALGARSGNKYHGGAWVVHVVVAIGGRELKVDLDSGFVADHENQLVILRSAFVGARRLLLLDARRARDDAKQAELAKPAA